MLLKSYAKINVSLKVNGRKEDGYHDIELVNLPIDLRDVIEIDLLPSNFIDSYVTTDNPDLASVPENLCQRALNLMREKFKFKANFDIFIHKEIPFAAGLGGGSSNAAAVILGINSLLNLKAKKEDLHEVATAVGADVPYFLCPKPAILRGIGEKIETFKVKKKYECLIIKPEQGLSTHEVYEACDETERLPIDTAGVVAGLEKGDDKLIEASMGNDLFPAAEKMCPEVGKILRELKADGYPLSAMTGSGSTVFALSSNPKKDHEILKKYLSKGYTVRLCKVLA
ncbi:MAG: 4-(cytidine 5'-diphospho)-2-C-methyl-D-erythritol kinase [Bacillota bacterium]|nr:4-(cytidine 5'-diphospho)-2-C-methyl-D-erythritol kinase [Bacillota bacterium]